MKDFTSKFLKTILACTIAVLSTLVLISMPSCMEDVERSAKEKRSKPVEDTNCWSKKRGSRPACWSEKDWKAFCQRVECKK